MSPRAPIPKSMEQSTPAPSAQEQSAFDLIIFDLDGTLIETAGEITDAVNVALLHMGLPIVQLSQTRDWVGQGAEVFFDRAIKASGQEPTSEAYSAGLEVFMHEYGVRSGSNSQVYAHVEAALSKLRSDGVALCVVTNKVKAFADQTLAAHGLLEYFNVVVGGDSMPNKKPAPDGVLHCMEQCKVQADKTLFVGDSVTDVQTARNAGIPVWLLPYGYNHGLPVEEAGADRLIADFSIFL